MQQFNEKYHDQIMGVVTGFDRLVFRSSLRRLNYGWWDEQLEAMVAIGISGTTRFCSIQRLPATRKTGE